MSAVAVDKARELKREGQQASLFDLELSDHDFFMVQITAFRPGAEFSANDIRAALDEKGVPEKSRAGLWAGACKAGLIEPVLRVYKGRPFPATETSTGASARGAQVRIYRRKTRAPREGR